MDASTSLQPDDLQAHVAAWAARRQAAEAAIQAVHRTYADHESALLDLATTSATWQVELAELQRRAVTLGVEAARQGVTLAPPQPLEAPTINPALAHLHQRIVATGNIPALRRLRGAGTLAPTKAVGKPRRAPRRRRR